MDTIIIQTSTGTVSSHSTHTAITTQAWKPLAPTPSPVSITLTHSNILTTSPKALNSYTFQSLKGAFSVIGEEIGVVCGGSDLVFGGSVSGSIYCWDASTGLLLATLSAHYKAITALTLSSCQQYLVSGSQDSILKIHSLHTAILHKPLIQSVPQRTMSEHSLPVTAVHQGVGLEGRGNVYSASLDKTVKKWFGGRNNVETINFPCALTALVVDALELQLFCGTVSGDILTTSVNTSSSATFERFEGHTQKVFKVALNMDETLLVSGSFGGDVRVWDRGSRSLLRVFGENVVGMWSGYIFDSPKNDDAIKSQPIKFGRYVVEDAVRTQDMRILSNGKENEELKIDSGDIETFLKESKSGGDDEVTGLKKRVAELEKLNRELFTALI